MNALIRICSWLGCAISASRHVQVVKAALESALNVMGPLTHQMCSDLDCTDLEFSVWKVAPMAPSSKQTSPAQAASRAASSATSRTLQFATSASQGT